MKYPIEDLFKHEKILCHEVRATVSDNQHILLHFFISQPLIENQLPRFKMGFEVYEKNKNYVDNTVDEYTSSSDSKTIKEINHPKSDQILDYSFIYIEDTSNVLFINEGLNEKILKNEWTGEKEDDDVGMNNNVRYVSEMTDNSIYNTDASTKKPTYLSHQEDETLSEPASEAMIEIYKNEQKNSHSIWNSSFHFDKFSECKKEEIIILFNKYKGYIAAQISPNLHTESKLNIDMESIFGTSFDIVRIKTNLFNNHDDSDPNNLVTNNLIVS